ncbi:MAG: hypothetical protein R3C56_30260 [Pirellulaceae bacterium]
MGYCSVPAMVCGDANYGTLIERRGTSMVIGLLPIETDPSQVVDGFRDELVVFGSQAYFLGYTKATGGKLYRTDGTEAGTQPFGGETILRSSSMVELAGTLFRLRWTVSK